MDRFVRKKEFEVFWAWFQKNEKDLSRIPAEEAALQVSRQLSSRWAFTIEIGNGSPGPGGKKKLFLSPDRPEHVLAARQLVSCAPELQYFTVSVQRVNRTNFSTLHPDDLEVEAAFTGDSGLIDLLIYLPDPEEEQEEEDFIQQLFSLLEELLGEHVVATKIGEVTVDHIKNATQSFPLMDLPEWLHDQTKNRL